MNSQMTSVVFRIFIEEILNGRSEISNSTSLNAFHIGRWTRLVLQVGVVNVNVANVIVHYSSGL